MATAELHDRPPNWKLLPNGQRYLRSEMERRSATVTSLALRLGISRKHLSNIVNGRVPLVEPLLTRLAKAARADAYLLGLMRDRGYYPGRPDVYGCMAGTVTLLADPTEPMEGWEVIED